MHVRIHQPFFYSITGVLTIRITRNLNYSPGRFDCEAIKGGEEREGGERVSRFAQRLVGGKRAIKVN